MTLNEQYAVWATVRSETALNDLMHQVRQVAMSNSHDDDVAQQVSITVLEKLTKFQPKDALAFSRYVIAIAAKHRLKKYAARQLIQPNPDAEETAPEPIPAYISLGKMNDFQRQVATSILQGYSLKEIAGQMNLKESTLRKKLFDIRNEKSLPLDI